MPKNMNPFTTPDDSNPLFDDEPTDSTPRRSVTLSPEKLSDYLANPDKCPVCDSVDLEGLDEPYKEVIKRKGLSEITTEYHHPVGCCTCWAEWTDVGTGLDKQTRCPVGVFRIERLTVKSTYSAKFITED